MSTATWHEGQPSDFGLAGEHSAPYDWGSVASGNAELAEPVSQRRGRTQEHGVGGLREVLSTVCHIPHAGPDIRLTLIPMEKPNTSASKSKIMSKCGLQATSRIEKTASRQVSRYFAMRAPVRPIRVSMR